MYIFSLILFPLQTRGEWKSCFDSIWEEFRYLETTLAGGGTKWFGRIIFSLWWFCYVCALLCWVNRIVRNYLWCWHIMEHNFCLMLCGVPNETANPIIFVSACDGYWCTRPSILPLPWSWGTALTLLLQKYSYSWVTWHMEDALFSYIVEVRYPS